MGIIDAMKNTCPSLPRVAIVRGGLDGVMGQLKAWALERGVARQEKRVAALDTELATARERLSAQCGELAAHWADHQRRQKRLATTASAARPVRTALRLVKS